MKFKPNRFVRYVNEEQGCVFTFGKYKGLTLTEVLDEQERQNYLQWMVDEVEMDSDLGKFLEEALATETDPSRTRSIIGGSRPKEPKSLGDLLTTLKEKKGGVR